MLDKRLQNPKRSFQDPTELNARLAAIEARLDKLEEVKSRLDVFIPNSGMDVNSDRRDWAGGA